MSTFILKEVQKGGMDPKGEVAILTSGARIEWTLGHCLALRECTLALISEAGKMV